MKRKVKTFYGVKHAGAVTSVYNAKKDANKAARQLKRQIPNDKKLIYVFKFRSSKL